MHTHTMISDGLTRTQLDNGLTLLTRAVHSAPVTSFWVWYRVGSRNERRGQTGLSHWVEHMLFKGTPTYPQGDYDRLVQRQGGSYNGMTWLDWTTYYETLPSDRIDLALRIEADRMTNALFAAEETESERTVIIAEREGRENQPTYQLFEQVQALSFAVHPYRHMVIGCKEDLQRITRDELYGHYRHFYRPDNAVLVVVGDFERAAMVGRISELFGGITAGRKATPAPAKEPQPEGERRIHMTGPGGATYLSLAYRVPGAAHPDFFPLVVMDAVLSGAKGLPPLGGGGLGRSARLYRNLVNTEIAVSASSGMRATLDPYLFTLSATAHPAHPTEVVESALIAELAQLAETPVSAAELKKAIEGARAQFAYASESVTNQAKWLGFSEIVASTAWLAGFLDELAGVSAEDVQGVAQTYFSAENRVVGWYVSENGAEE